ncbi:MAG: 4Fe-4S dicluster domain-containing protein, partial [Desulforhopalus sp.]
EVDEIGRVGLEMLLMSLACGAASVTLVFDRELPEDLQQILKRQVYLGKDILSALQIPAGKMRLLPYGREHGGADMANFPPKDPTTYPAQQPMETATLLLDTDRRNVVRQMAAYLNGRYGSEQKCLALSPAAPFGTISISSSCSFCMACVSICPSGALKTGGKMPRLSMVESRCLQCSLCEAVCPEQAIEMLPRLLLDCRAADTQAVLREEEPFHCVECGKPFASRKMISRMEEKLRDHWMYNSDRQARRLQMCRNCRTHDALVAGDYQP